jgi:membrane-associated protein
MDFFRQLFDVQHGGLENLIRSFGYLLVFGIVFAETGLLVGFLLPGDSLLFMAGLVAAKGHLNIGVLIVLLSVAAIAGDTVGYFIGRKAGPLLFAKPDSRLFKRKHLESAQAFYEKHGPKTIILARFVPIVRTFAPTVAGAAGMAYRQFIVYNVIGGIAWIVSMSLLGYFLGNVIPAKHLDKAVIAIIILSIAPMILHAMKEKKAAKSGLAAVKAEKGKPFATD